MIDKRRKSIERSVCLEGSERLLRAVKAEQALAVLVATTELGFNSRSLNGNSTASTVSYVNEIQWNYKQW